VQLKSIAKYNIYIHTKHGQIKRKVLPEIILRVVWRSFSTLRYWKASASQQLAHIVDVRIYWSTRCTADTTQNGI